MMYRQAITLAIKTVFSFFLSLSFLSGGINQSEAKRERERKELCLPFMAKRGSVIGEREIELLILST